MIKSQIKKIVPFIFILSSCTVLAAGGFEKPVLWSARAALVGGAYGASVKGSEAILFNPAGLIQDKNEIALGATVIGGKVTAPLVQNNHEVSSYVEPVYAGGMTYAHQLDSKSALGFGIYGLGGLKSAYKHVNLNSLGSEFSGYRPNANGELSVIEFSAGYSHRLNQNLSLGIGLRANYATAKLEQFQISEARGLGGFGIPDGTVLAASGAKFDNMKGSNFGSYRLGLQYKSDDQKWGLGLVYRSSLTFKLKGDVSGKVVYSNAGAAVTGATAGATNTLSGGNATIESSIPQAVTLSSFYFLSPSNMLTFEYSWTDYSKNQELKINGKLSNPVDNSTTDIANNPLKWHDLHDFKLGLLNTSLESWVFGGGYALSLPVSDKSTAGATFAVPGKYHHFYAGVGKIWDAFRVDIAAEYYMGKAQGHTKETSGTNQVNPSVKGEFETQAYSLFTSASYLF